MQINEVYVAGPDPDRASVVIRNLRYLKSFLIAFFQAIQNVVVGRLVFKPDTQDSCEALSQIYWYHFDKFLAESSLCSFLQPLLHIVLGA